jgi:hypothetical protein
MASLYRPESRSDPYDASVENLKKARASCRYHPPLPWHSKEEAEMIRRFVFLWLTGRDNRRPSGRDWARQLGISHTWLQKLVREFTANESEMRRLQGVLLRSTRPFACGEFAAMMRISRRSHMRPNCVVGAFPRSLKKN